MPTLVYPDVPLHELMRATARRLPNRVAIRFHERTITFQQFDELSNRLANGLRALGFANGERLALYTPNCPEFELAFYAASKLGGIACALNPSYREFEITHQLNDSGSIALVTHASLWPIVAAAWPQLPTLRHVIVIGGRMQSETVHTFDSVLLGQPSDPPAVRVSPDDVVALPYSSGTTRRPKGVMLTHRNLVANHIQFGTASALGPDDTYLVYLPLSHIYGTALMGLAMWSGAQQIVLERFELPTVVRLIQDYHVTWLHVVPPVLLALANSPGLETAQFRTIKFALNAGAPLAPDVARRVERRLGFRVIQAYGLTETSPDTHHSPLEPSQIVLESGGVPVADTEQRVVDLETGETLPCGEAGEIIVRGPQVMKGYWNAPEETRQVLRNGWLHTGDIGRIDERGYVFIVDRKKEMIKYKGWSIAPAELEALLLEHADVEDCAVIGVPDTEAGEVPRAFVVPRPGCRLEPEVLTAFVAARVAGYKTIRQWQFVDKIPRTPSGKVLRRMLKQQVGDQSV
jgi:long-chain acyl-CoA synthetase